jgi:hypothetical protein
MTKDKKLESIRKEVHKTEREISDFFRYSYRSPKEEIGEICGVIPGMEYLVRGYNCEAEMMQGEP